MLTRIWFGLAVLALASGALFLRRATAPGDAPESTVTGGGLIVREFSLHDVRGIIHSPAEWQDTKAVVLIFLGTECPVSNGYAPEMERLFRTYGPRRIAFYGLHSDPDVTRQVAARHAAEYGLSFPILLDLAQVVARQAGVRVTPEAAVLTEAGQVLYHGRIDDRYSVDGRHRDKPRTRELVDALDAVLADEMPAVTRSEAFGCPLPPVQAAPPSESDGPITFNKHVAPILWRNCAGCHRPGELGPFPLLTYKDASKRAEFLKRVVTSRRMPPWKPEPGYGTFLDDLRLTDREVGIISEWADGGAVEGGPADLPPPPKFPEGWVLGMPDLVVEMPEPFQVGGSDDIYRAFILPLPRDRDRTVAAVEFRPGNRKIVHHARLFINGGDELRRRDQATPGPGFNSFGGGDIQRPGLAEWTPGTIPRHWPEGVGKVLKAGSDLVLLIHYHPSGKPESDRSSVGLYLSKTPRTREMASVPLTTTKIDIPPNVPRHKIELTASLPTDVHAFGLIPHGHYLLRELKLTATLADQRVLPLLWIKDWDLNWQGQYQYAKPVKLPKGTELHLVAYYDNSAENPKNPNSPPRRVRFGLGSSDEMLGCHVKVLADHPEGYQILRKKWPAAL